MRNRMHQVNLRLDDREREYLNKLGQILSLNDQSAIRMLVKEKLDAIELDRARRMAG